MHTQEVKKLPEQISIKFRILGRI